MLLKLTYYRNNKTTLVNSSVVKLVFPVYNKLTEEHVTKIEFIDGTFINVQESLEEIYYLSQSQDETSPINGILAQV